MKSPEEKIDEALREALKRKFDNFESVPDPSLSEKVWRALNISDNPGIIQQSIILGLLFMIIVTGALLFTSGGDNNHVGLTKKSKSFAVKVKSKLADARKAYHKEQKVSIASANRTPAPALLTKHDLSDLPKISFQKEEQIQVASSVTSRFPTGKRVQSTTAQPGKFENTDQQVFGGTAKDFVNVPVDNEPQIDDIAPATQVNELENRPLDLPKFAWNNDSIISLSESKERIKLENKDDWAFIVSAAPLRTFQTLTIGQTNGVIYQNFSFPTRISAETLGYKFTAGVEKNGFQLLVNYGRFRQSFKYEIARDEYMLQPNKAGEYKVVRKGTPVEENSVSNLLGLSVKKHIVRKTTFLKNYFGDLGLELNRDLTSGTNMVWINAGFGKELFVDRNTRITVGPYIEYSLMKLRNDQNRFTVQPYQIGLSVGLRYLKK